MSRIPDGVKTIAGQSVKPRPFVNGSRTGTQTTPGYGRTQGMKPADFSAFKSIAKQKVTSGKGSAGSAAARAAVQPARAPRSSPSVEEKKSASEKLLDAAKKRFQMAAESEAAVRRDSLDDLKFLAGDQWEDGIKRQRHMDGRPCLTINRLPQFVRQVTNEQRQNRPSIQVNPVSDGADVETAEVLQGLIRHIEYDSAADAAYDTAFFGAASCGFGYFRVTTEYSDPLSFEQDIKIVRVRNPFTVYLDPNAKEPDFSDAEWGFVVETMSRDAYKAAYPDSELSQMEDWQSIGDTNTDWIGQDACRVAEYFWRERKLEKIVQLSDGSVLRNSDLDEKLPSLPDGVEVVHERETQISTIQWAKLNGVEVLEETEWAGRWIPIVKVVGDEFDIDGKVVLKGIVRDAKEPQQQYNFMKSASTEAIALAPKAPYVGAEGQFEGYEREWQQANVKNHAYLQYKPVSIGGTPAPPPQRNVAEPAIQAINLAMMESADDLKAVTGIYDAALGSQGNETSGKAILARQQQAQGANFHYIDNLTRAIRYCGRILLDLIPKVYDTARVVRIIGENGDQKTVAINQSAHVTAPDGALRRIYDLGAGRYDVTISTGPSYQSRRQEAVSSIIDLTKSYPALFGVAGDILIKNMDWPGSQEIAARLKKSLPPQLQQEESDAKSPLPPQAQQQIAQMVQQIQQLTQALQTAQDDLHRGTSIKQMETESRERIAAGQQRIDELKLDIERQKVQATLLMAQMKSDAAKGDANAQMLFEYLARVTGENGTIPRQRSPNELQPQVVET